jgi:hypothetical protein
MRPHFGLIRLTRALTPVMANGSAEPPDSPGACGDAPAVERELVAPRDPVSKSPPTPTGVCRPLLAVRRIGHLRVLVSGYGRSAMN